ncbi:MAG: LysR family transcriptional regulator [Alphaproteobacteria bacterium]|nr:LysR family transcriptional regulator [Alphaproteobacteria bacterium]
MQAVNWDDLKCLLALHRKDGFSDAGRSLGVSETTVARRVRRLEQRLEVSLFIRNGAGGYDPTDEALAIISHAEAVEREIGAIRELAGQAAERAQGVVSISSVPFIINRFLVRHLAAFQVDHPALSIELAPEPGNVDLSKRAADLAIRFSRPTHGGLKIKARKLGTLSFDLYCSAGHAPGHESELKWIGYDDAHASLPQARWIEAEIAGSAAEKTALRVADLETALEAAAGGAGKTFLPVAVCGDDRRLRLVSKGRAPKRLSRDVWLLSHTDQAGRASVEAASAWLAALPWR